PATSTLPSPRRTITPSIRLAAMFPVALQAPAFQTSASNRGPPLPSFPPAINTRPSERRVPIGPSRTEDIEPEVVQVPVPGFQISVLRRRTGPLTPPVTNARRSGR